MCQWGAYEYSRIGWTYLQILDHYYNLDWYYDYGDGGLVEAEIPPIPEPLPEIPVYYTLLYGLLENIATVFFHIAGRFGLLADAVRDKAIIGPLFYIPLDFIATRFDDAWLITHDLAVRSNEYHRFVTDLLQGTLFHTLLLVKIPGIGGLLADPVTWVRNQVNEILGELQRLRDNPTAWILDKLYSWIPWLQEFFDEPSAFMLRRFRERYPALALMIDEPLIWILRVFRDSFPQVWGFWHDPEGWVRDRIQRWLNASSGLWTHTWSYIWYKITEVLTQWGTYYAPWFRSYGSKLLRYLFEGVWSE
jgi:hypothetical protein